MTVVEIEKLSHRYEDRMALDAISLQVSKGEIFGLLGPNGGGKTTLFRILCTLFPVVEGKVLVLGHDLKKEANQVRKEIGVVFQAPSLDKKLTVLENLRHQGHLYGLSGEVLERRCSEMLEQLGVNDRFNDLIEKLSGGLQRRVEIAKALLHSPKILLLDEPSTGLDPGVRKELWNYLNKLRDQDGVTILLTTHLMEEAEQCDRLAILDSGKIVTVNSPDALRSKLGNEVITARTKDPKKLSHDIQMKFGVQPVILDDTIRMEYANGHEFIARLVESFPGQIDSISVGKPTLEDVFIHLTGHRFWTSKGEGRVKK